MGKFDFKQDNTFERKNALMRAYYNGAEPEDWITVNEDGIVNWDRWIKMWCALEYRFSFEDAKTMQIAPKA